MMHDDDVNTLAEKATRELRTFISDRLAELGYGCEYVEANKYDFVTVRNQVDEPGADISGCVVHIPTESILFGFTLDISQLQVNGAAHIELVGITVESEKDKRRLQALIAYAREQAISAKMFDQMDQAKKDGTVTLD